MKVITTGRTDLDDLFRLSAILDQKLTHTPFLVFVVQGDAVEVQVVDRARDLSRYPDDTPVMVQWRGQWRSDFFRLTAGDVRGALETKLAQIIGTGGAALTRERTALWGPAIVLLWRSDRPSDCTPVRGREQAPSSVQAPLARRLAFDGPTH